MQYSKEIKTLKMLATHILEITTSLEEPSPVKGKTPRKGVSGEVASGLAKFKNKMHKKIHA